MENTVSMRNHGLVVDLFAGGGGFSVGCEKAMGRSIDIALNHDREAIALHTANHPKTHHYCQDIEHADPLAVTGGRPVFWLHASPSCTQHSRSRRALPAEEQAREHGWKVVEWIGQTRPLIFTCENVPEYRLWGPLDAFGFPDKTRIGETFKRWCDAICAQGYVLEWRDINAADLGAATARERMILVARRDGFPIEWPNLDYGPGRDKPWQAVCGHIDWSRPAPSIFDRKKSLADATLRRIHKGIMRHIVNNNDPFYAPKEASICSSVMPDIKIAAFLAQNHAQLPGRSLHQPLSTICTKAAGQSLVTMSFIDVARTGNAPASINEPLGAISTSGGHHAEVRVAAFAAGYYSQGGGQLHDLRRPIGTITTKDRFAIVEVQKTPSVIVDIGYRFLTADELWSITGFPDDYKRSVMAGGRPMPATSQKRMIGNAVVPIVAQRIVEANLAPIDRALTYKIAA